MEWLIEPTLRFLSTFLWSTPGGSQPVVHGAPRVRETKKYIYMDACKIAGNSWLKCCSFATIYCSGVDEVQELRRFSHGDACRSDTRLCPCDFDVRQSENRGIWHVRHRRDTHGTCDSKIVLTRVAPTCVTALLMWHRWMLFNVQYYNPLKPLTKYMHNDGLNYFYPIQHGSN